MRHPSQKNENEGHWWEFDVFGEKSCAINLCAFILLGPRNILACDRNYVPGQWPDLAAAAVVSWATFRTFVTSTCEYNVHSN